MNACPFRYQGQYEDIETGLYYNRFRYYSPSEGMYISQDPIGLLGNNPTLYGYVKDVNTWIDVWGLKGAPASLPNTSGVYVLTNDTLKEQNASNSAYVGSSVTMNDRVSDTDYTKAQELLAHPDTKVQYVSVDLGEAESRGDRGNILRHYEQQQMDAAEQAGYSLSNDRRAESELKEERNEGLIDEHGASAGEKKTCED